MSDDVRAGGIAHLPAGTRSRAAVADESLGPPDEPLGTLYEALPCGIIVRDASGRIVFANSAVKRILRADVDPSEGRLWMPSRARAREDGSDLPPSETPGAIAARTGEPIRDFAMRVTRIDGTECWLLVDAVPLKDETGRIVRVVTSFIDITERKRLEAQLQHRALHDQLTGLPNRWLFLDRVAQSVSLAKRAERAGPALLFADLDGFKALNDRCGHAAGDAMLQEASHRFRSVLRDSDTVARIGGDEFGILLPLAEHADEAAAVSHKFETALEAPWAFKGNDIRLGASVGIAMAPVDGTDADSLFSAADARMYAVKRSRGRGGRH